MAGPAAPELPPRHLAQLRVDGRDQPVEGLFVPGAPGVDQFADVGFDHDPFSRPFPE
jgi:hypothetical protein